MWVIFYVCLSFGALVRAQTPTVTISQGKVQGAASEDGNYFEFYGIPYADSTSGSNRFKAPRAAPSFEDTFIANRKGIKCVTATGTGYEGTEDCLVLNVFTKDLNKSMPVMVWIKGHEFDKVTYQFSFRKFVEKDVVIVELNFRESILGFLCLGTETAPGNAGLKDIVEGLKWIKENIAQFGGDPNNVSIFGHGSGAAAVDLMTLSPMTKGLVHKAIAQSGSATAPWAVTRDNLAPAIKVAEGLGHTVTSVQQLSQIFSRTSVTALMAVINELDLTDNSLPFAPCVERENLENVEPFLTQTPYLIINDKELQQIPFMTSFVDYEGTIRAEEADDWMGRMESSFVDFLPADLKFENDDEKQNIANQVKQFYFSDQNMDLLKYFKYHGDTMILFSALEEAILRTSNSDSPVYVYQISYDGKLGELFLDQAPLDSAVHGEELAYLFYDSPDTTVPDKDLKVSDILIERWTNFAKTGQPTSDTGIEWRPFTVENPYFLRLLDAEESNNDSRLEIEISNGHQDVLAFWDPIYEKHFLDGELRWDLIRDDDEASGDNGDDENGNGENENGENGNDGDENGNGENENGNEENENGNGEDEDIDTSSAPKIVASTFLIMIISLLLR